MDPKFVVDKTTTPNRRTIFEITKVFQETNNTSQETRDQELSNGGKMSQFGQEFGSECCSEVGSIKLETLKTNLLFLNSFAVENKEMIIVFFSKP